MIRKMFRKPKSDGESGDDGSFAPQLEEAPVHDVPAPSQAQVPAQAERPAPPQAPKPPVKASEPLPKSEDGPLFTAEDLKTSQKTTWCPGCGNHGIWFALKNALQRLGTPQEKFVLVNGIGCHGHMCNFVHLYNFEGLHGRPIPVAEGIKLANDGLKVIVVAGDGDTYGEGMNHFLAGVRANHDITLLVHNNMVYGLTTGQTSPTSQHGYKSKSTPDGVIEVPVNPMALAISAGGGFVSRGFAGNVKHLTELIVKAVRHDGFSVVDILQNCVTFNKVNTIHWFNDRVYELEKEGYDPSDRMRALGKAFEFGEKTERIPIGVLYQDKRESYQDDLSELSSRPLLEHPVEGMDLLKAFEKYA